MAKVIKTQGEINSTYLRHKSVRIKGSEYESFLSPHQHVLVCTYWKVRKVDNGIVGNNYV